MATKNLLLFLIVFCFSKYSNAQPICFERTYDTLGSYYAYCIKQSFDGGFITCGSSYENFTAQNAVVIKTDSFGNIDWVWNYSSSGTDGAIHVEQLRDSTVIVSGFISTTQGYKVFLSRITNNGNSLWTKEYFLGPGIMSPSHLAITSDSGYAITGTIEDSLEIIYLIKLDSNGDSLWTKYYDYLPLQKSCMIIGCLDKGFLITGLGTGTTGPTDLDVYCIKTDSIGDTLWTKTYSRTQANNMEVGRGLTQLSDSTFFICGYSWNTINNYDIFLIKINENGDTLWTKLIGDSLENGSTCIKSLNDSSFIICGSTTVPGKMIQGYLLKLNAEGDTIWTKAYGGNDIEILDWVEYTSDFGFVSCGEGAGILIVKTDSSGNNLTAINELSNSFLNFEFFPNPFNTSSHLYCKNKRLNAHYNVLLYDILGNVIQKYYWNPIDALLLERDNLPSGIYCLNILDSNMLIYSKKIIIN